MNFFTFVAEDLFVLLGTITDIVKGSDNNYFSGLSTAPKLDYFKLIDSPSPSLTAPVLCYVFYVIITILFNDTCAYLIFFFFFNFNNSKEVS